MCPFLSTSVRVGIGMAGYPGKVLLGEGNHSREPFKAKQASSKAAVGVVVVVVVVVVVYVVVNGATAVLVAGRGEDEHLPSHPDLTGRE